MLDMHQTISLKIRDNSSPFIFRHADLSSVAAKTWTLDRMADIFDDQEITVKRTLTDSFYSIRMKEFVAYVSSSDEYVADDCLCLVDFFLNPSFDDHLRLSLYREISDFTPQDPEIVGWTSMYIGPKGASSPIHQDVYDTGAWMTVLSGQKLWKLAPPSDDAPVHFTHEYIVGPGDLVYAPPNWWHTVRNISASIAISGNFCKRSDALKHWRNLALNNTTPEMTNWSRTWKSILNVEA